MTGSVKPLCYNVLQNMHSTIQNGRGSMKKVIIAVSIICLFATCSFAGDLIFSPIIEKPAPGEMDTYIVTSDDGPTKVLNVISYDYLDDDTYAIIDNKGNTTIIMKMDD